jgi:calcineurin-like phosphoesterase family protein
MATTKFTSDLHLGHRSIIDPDYTSRGTHMASFGCLEEPKKMPTIEEHDRWVVSTLNQHLSPTDQVWILGDVGWSNKWYIASLVSQINGHKHLVRGNHDHSMIDFWKSTDVFESVQSDAYFRYNGVNIHCYHYPVAEWNNGHHKSWMLHGHTHSNFDYGRAGLANKRILDVGFDNSLKVFGQYKPFSFEDIEKLFEGRESIEHHGKAD